ncbi:hypothetical protein WDZ92_44220, partial [Nostoc sp. NIES-2111]
EKALAADTLPVRAPEPAAKPQTEIAPVPDAQGRGPAVTVTPIPPDRTRSSRHYTPSDMLFAFLIGVGAGVLGVYGWSYVHTHGLDLSSIWPR